MSLLEKASGQPFASKALTEKSLEKEPRMSNKTIFSMGRICYKTKGRDAGEKVVIVESAKNGFALIEGLRTKKSRSNVSHLLPTKQTVKISSGYSKEDITNALQPVGKALTEKEGKGE